MKTEEFEKLAEKVHKVYCEQYLKDNGKPYWTEGDYSKLDERTKQYDRNIVTLMESYAQEKCREQRDSDNSNIDKLLDAQIGEVAVFVDRCARDKGMANREFDKWIKDTPKIQYHKNTPLVTTKTDK